ncbi:MAG: glycosyl hydrolase family 17 protein [Saprospiraceae bacterium]
MNLISTFNPFYRLFFLFMVAPFVLAAQTPFCLNFSPYYKVGQDPRRGSNIPTTQILQGLNAVKPYCNCIRIFSPSPPLDSVAYLAKEMGFETIIVGIWLDSDTLTNAMEIENGIALAQAGVADRLIVGSEAGLRNEFPISRWVEYINYVKAEVPGIPVSVADIYGVLIANPELVEAVDFLYYNAYPYWEGEDIDCAPYAFNEMYRAIQEIAGDKEIMVSETGWPTDGNTIGQAVPNLVNLQSYLSDLLAWKEYTGIPLTWFSAFDEPWKYSVTNPQEGYWGLFTYNPDLDSLILKPGLHEILTQSPVIDSTVWTCQFIANDLGRPNVTFNQIPTFGDPGGILCGKVDGIRPCDYNLALYIKVNGSWWVKPTYADKKIRLACDGSFCIDVVTGGQDRYATEYQLFLLDKDCNPPGLGNAGSIPDSLYEKAIIHEVITRTPFEYGQFFMEGLNQVIKRGDTLSIPVKVLNFDTILQASGGIYSGDRAMKLINAYSDQFADQINLTIVDSTDMTFVLGPLEEGMHIPDSTTLFTIELVVGDEMSYCRSVNFSNNYMPFQVTHFVDQQPQIINPNRLSWAVVCPTVPLKLYLDSNLVYKEGVVDLTVRTADFIRIMAFDVALKVDPELEILEMKNVNLTHGYEYQIIDGSTLLFHYDVRDTNEIFRSDNRELFQFRVGIKETFDGCSYVRFSNDSLYRRSIQLVRLDTTILRLDFLGEGEICIDKSTDPNLLDILDITVFPNPVGVGQNLKIHIAPNSQENNIKSLHIQVVDMLGRRVFTENLQNIFSYRKEIQLSSGMYVVWLQDEEGRNFRTMVVVQ